VGAFSYGSGLLNMGNTLFRIAVGGNIPNKFEGHHKTVGQTFFRFPLSVRAQVFYPAVAGNVTKQKPFMRPEAIFGLSLFVDKPLWMFSFFEGLPHPFLSEAEPSLPENDGKLPCVIFSHGLGGHCEMYQKLCGDIASHGVIVIALEHEDRSGSYCAPLDASEPLYYQSPPGPPWQYNRETVPAFRKPFLDKRVTEIQQVVRHIQERSAPTREMEDKGTPLDIAEQVLQRVDTESTWMCGHSFGAATTVRVAQDEELKKVFKGAVLLDIWSYPLPDASIEEGISGLREGVLSILSEPFANNDETPVTRQLYKNVQFAKTPELASFWIPGCVHQQFSDVAFCFSPRIGKQVFTCGSTPVAESQRAIVRAISKFLGVSEKNAATSDGVEDTWAQIINEEVLESFI